MNAWFQPMRLAALLLGAMVLTALIPPPLDPVRQVDPTQGRHRAPGTRLFEVVLGDGRVLLADQVILDGDEVRLERRDGTLHLTRSQVMNLGSDGPRDHRTHWLGSDKFGRDVLSRLMVATRVSLTVGLLSVCLALLLGTTVGTFAATSRPGVDNLVMRIVDGIIAFPPLFLILALASVLRPSTTQVVVILGATSWMSTCRLARAEVLSLRQRDFVVAAHGLGLPRLRIATRHLIPNAATPLIVDSTLMVAGLVLSEAALSFLGLGIQPPTPSWGNMIGEGRDTLGSSWWVALFPGLAIALTVVAFNLLGDGLRDHFDPKLRSIENTVSEDERC